MAGLGREENRDERIRGGMAVAGQCYCIDAVIYKERDGGASNERGFREVWLELRPPRCRKVTLVLARASLAREST